MTHPSLRFAGCMLAVALFFRPMLAADPPGGTPPAADSSASLNAALIYWQAFAAMPTLPDEHQQKFDAAIKTVDTPVTEELRPTMALFGLSLGELQRARTAPVCDWQLNYEAGPQLLLPHLQKARELSRAALLRARLRFAAGEADAAVEDVVAVLKMARDSGRSPLLISLLVDIAIEKMAGEVLAANLPRLQAGQLDQLAVALNQLPPTATFADCVRCEGRIFGGWLERRVEAEAAKLADPQAGGQVITAIQREGILSGDGEPDAATPEGQRQRDLLQSLTLAEVRESLRRLRVDYEDMAKITSLNHADQATRWTEFEAGLAAARKLGNREDLLRIFSVALLPAVSKVYQREEQLHVRRNLLDLAVQVQRHGPEALQAARTYGNSKVEYRRTAAGFELQCQPASSDKPEIMAVGAPK